MLLENTYVVQAAIGASLAYVAGWFIYCRYFHPLSSIPGPFLASFSRVWIVFKTAMGDMEHTQRALHKKHGISIQSADAVPCGLMDQAILFESRPMRLPAPILRLSR